MHPPPWTSNPGGQRAFLKDHDHKFVALEGGWGGGKTFGGARKLLIDHARNNTDGYRAASAIIGPTYGNLADVDLPEMMNALTEANAPYQFKQNPPEFRFPGLGWAPIFCRSADRPDMITGWEVGAFWGDEAARWKEDHHNPKNDPLTQIKARLRAPKARILQGLFTYTNEGDHTAIYREFHSGYADHALYRAATRENPLMAEYYETQAAILTPELAEQYLEGGAMSLGGAMAYAGQFNASTHVQSDVQLSKHAPLCLILDFNISPGMHGYLGQHDPAGDRFVVTHEIHRSRLDVRGLVDQLGHMIGQLGGWQWPGELHVFGDATGKSEWAGTSASCYSILAQGLDEKGISYRLRVPASNPPVRDRVDAVCVALQDMGGRTHMVIHDRCKRLAEDFRAVRWGENGKELDKRNPALTHASDAIGYWVHYLRPARVTSRITPGRFNV